LIEKFIRETSFADDAERFNAVRAWIWSSIVSAFPFGAIFGSLMAATLSDKYGRKTTIFFNNIPAAIAGVLMTFAYPFKMWYLLLIGRFIIGVNAGISSGVITTILTEISPDNLRGMLGSCNQLFLTAAILFSNVLSFETIFGTEARWQYIFGFTFFPIITQLILLRFCPESPRYTLMFEHDEVQAEKDLRVLRERVNVRDEIDAMKREAIEREVH
uniref:Glucose transporter type 1 (inferred by orthology to a D. melanogaster protein) n=1 Tax=Anisakis simplex TaxID=6269 RepID=A0A0M3JC07_ANISI